MLEFNLPTYLTLLRIALIPLLVVIFYIPWEYSNLVCTFIFFVAAVTDWLDGYLAREMGQETAFGAFLDPVADKLMVAIVLVLLVQIEATPWMTIPALIIIGREITIASLREWMAEIGQRKKVAVSSLGKWKTGAQMLAIGCLLYRQEVLGLPIKQVGYTALYLSAILTIWSMIGYLKVSIQTIVEKQRQTEKSG